jgi:signal transduction histidine kinase
MKTILVIEDDTFIRESIRDVLELEGYQALTADNGAVGVDLALEQLPDLILCDVSMPQMDGYEVLQTLQCHHATSTIPFVFLTARTAKTDLRRAMNMGADDYLAKPCTAAELLKAITGRFAKQSLLQMRSEAQLKTLRDSIAQSLPHELYTPLNGILGFSELLYREHTTIQRAEVQEIAEGIHTSALRLHHLIKNFLLYSKLETIAHHPEQVRQLQSQVLTNPDELVRATAEQTAMEMQRQADLQFRLATSETIESAIDPLSAPEVTAMAVQIKPVYFQKIIEELTDNACKFSEPDTPIVIESVWQANQFVLTVANQGRGMTAEQIASLGAYMQFDRKYYEQQGLGLGLIISKRIAELHQGNLQIRSIPGASTVVQVRLFASI